MSSGWLALGAALVSAYAGYKSSQSQKDAVDNQNKYALELEREKLALARNSPGARFVPFGMDSLLSVFGNSMAGKASKFNVNDARINMGLRYPGDVNGYGPLYKGFDSWNEWSQSHKSPLFDPTYLSGGGNSDPASYSSRPLPLAVYGSTMHPGRGMRPEGHGGGMRGTSAGGGDGTGYDWHSLDSVSGMFEGTTPGGWQELVGLGLGYYPASWANRTGTTPNPFPTYADSASMGSGSMVY